ncbi:MAG TPA: BatD family protein [Polyangia bacterium]|nr:BatD family protein [Polyangia bacterium]
MRARAVVALAAVALAAVASAHARATADGGAPAAAAAAAPDSDPDAPTVTARADKTEGHVGDVFTLVVTAISKRGVPVNLPSTLDLAPFSLLDRKENESDLGDGRVRREFALGVAAYEPGEVEIPAVEVTYLGKGGEVRTAKTEPVAITIKSLIANDPEPTLKDAAPPVVVMQRNWLLLYVAAALAAAALGALVAWLVIRRLRARASARPGPPPRPPHEIALERLDRLGAYGFLENADNRPFYFAVSEVIREYLGARFGFDSLELTTDELVAELHRRAERELVLGEIEGWLSAADLVKFAKISPSAAESRGTLETAIRIVTSTRPRHEPPPAGAPAPAPEGARA